MRMSKAKQQRLTEKQRHERIEQELYNIHRQLAEHYEKAGDLWARVDGRKGESTKSYQLAAENMENACVLLQKAAIARTADLSREEGEPDDQ